MWVLRGYSLLHPKISKVHSTKLNSFFPCCSYFGCFGTESRPNYIAGRCIELINIGIDFPTHDSNRNIRSWTHGSLLLATMEKFSHHAVRNSWLFLWFICKHNGLVKSNTASNNVNRCSPLLETFIYLYICWSQWKVLVFFSLVLAWQRHSRHTVENFQAQITKVRKNKCKSSLLMAIKDSRQYLT